MAKKKTEQQLKECYEHIKPYIGKQDAPELFEMCKNCECFCGEEHDFEECREKPCFRNWLAFEYLEWTNAFN